ncbi:MAG: YdcF family protein [Myxococcaceae bacterium]|nr:YdcF family protein [Myxococcaceae bacterium]MCA3011603.1 YdcF family protein [Myxococcaceae bacterium]
MLLPVLGLVGVAAGGLVARVHRAGRRRPALHRRDAIVVLGAKVHADGTPSEALSARVAHAVGLYREGGAPRLVFSGAGGGRWPEAAVARALAQRAGVPEAACLEEPESRSTWENARFTAALLGARGLRTAWLVTDDFHVLRAVAHFRRLGVDVEAAPVSRPLAPARRLSWTVREALALARRPWLLW